MTALDAGILMMISGYLTMTAAFTVGTRAKGRVWFDGYLTGLAQIIGHVGAAIVTTVWISSRL